MIGDKLTEGEREGVVIDVVGKRATVLWSDLSTSVIPVEMSHYGAA